MFGLDARGSIFFTLFDVFGFSKTVSMTSFMFMYGL